MIKEAMDAFVSATNRQWKHDRTKTVGSSEIGLCARKIFWVKHEAEPDSDHVDGWGARVRGNVMENSFWVPGLGHKFGTKFVFAGHNQKTIADGPLSTTPDGLLRNLKPDCLKGLGIPDIGSDCILVECKTIDPRVNLYKEKEENAYQVQVQLGLIRKLTKYKPNYALISYTDASFWNEILEFPIKFDEKIFAQAELRANQILNATDGSDFLPEGYIAGGRECEYCPFAKRCGVMRRSVPEKEAIDNDPQFVAEVVDLCSELIAIKRKIEATEAEQRAKEQEIKDRLRTKGVRKIPKVVTWSAVKGRTSYDNKAIKEEAIAAGIDVEKYSTVGEPSDRLQITYVPPNGDTHQTQEAPARKAD